MEVAVDESERVEPSAALLEVHRCMGEMVISAGELQADGGGALDNQERFVFVESLRSWFETGGAIAVLDDLFGLEPKVLLLEDPTFDVLLHFSGMCGAIQKLWKGAPKAARGLLLPIIFQFFGVLNPVFVTSSE
jgi:hypothetical protein